ncbi:hypothetical protein KGQ71_02265 [Patescibacteria group bacterium]|nr:hypothetical protein [Patescibacteria group bacterium]
MEIPGIDRGLISPEQPELASGEKGQITPTELARINAAQKVRENNALAAILNELQLQTAFPDSPTTAGSFPTFFSLPPAATEDLKREEKRPDHSFPAVAEIPFAKLPGYYIFDVSELVPPGSTLADWGTWISIVLNTKYIHGVGLHTSGLPWEDRRVFKYLTRDLGAGSVHRRWPGQQLGPKQLRTMMCALGGNPENTYVVSSNLLTHHAARQADMPFIHITEKLPPKPTPDSTPPRSFRARMWQLLSRTTSPEDHF